jgi:hypothetical protein
MNWPNVNKKQTWLEVFYGYVNVSMVGMGLGVVWFVVEWLIAR